MERREFPRQEMGLIVNVEAPSQKHPRVGVARDVSPRGLLLGCSRALNVGEHVKLTVAEKGRVQTLEGEVVRCVRNPAAEISLWRYLNAVSLSDPATFTA